MKKLKNKRVSVIVTIAIVALCALLLINAIEIGVGLFDKYDKKAELISANTAQSEINSELANQLEKENESEIFDDIAREDYDYIYPDERVYGDSAN
ncbi:MAG: hypothetical protein IIW48_02530 [Clostridia bacterium]|nr:hypothetical protein [Clostridia bacterium]